MNDDNDGNMDRGDSKRFSKWSRSYEHSLLQKLFFDRVHDAVLALAKKECEPGAILDVGCGTGRLLRKAGKAWPGVMRMGIDAAPGMIDVARGLAPDIMFHAGTAEALPLPDASMDITFSTTSFHHWNDQAKGIREIARVLRPGGCFFLADVAPPMWMANHMHHEHFLDKKSLRGLFDDAGLQIIVQKRVAFHFALMTAGRKYSTEIG